MRIILFSLFVLFYCSSLFAQRNLFNQKYVSISEDFIVEDTMLEDYRSQGKIEVFNEEKHKTRLAKKLLTLKSGKTKTFKSDYYQTKYKVVSQQEIPHFRVRYIFINKNKFDSTEGLDNYIKKVRALLNQTTFKSVAMQYSMDYRKNVGGDSGWFKKGKTQPEFFDQVTNTNKLSEEVFEFEIAETNGYYFAQKLWSSKSIKESLVFYTIEKK